MHISSSTKQLLLILALYFFLTWSLTGVYFITHLEHVPDGWADWHQRISTEQVGDSNQFRLMSYWFAEAINQSFGQPIFSAYLIVRFICTFVLFGMFHLFLLRWFRPALATLGVMLLAAFMPITFLPYLQESDIVLYPFFLGAIWTIRERSWWLAPLVFIGTFAKETMAFIVLLYPIVVWGKNRRLRTAFETVGLTGVWMAAFLLTRNAFFAGSNSSLWQLPKNIATLGQAFDYGPLISIYIYFIPLLGIFWVLPFINQKIKPHFLQRVAPYVIAYTVLHFLMGWPYETRIMLPLAFLVIPSGLYALFVEINKKPTTHRSA